VRLISCIASGSVVRCGLYVQTTQTHRSAAAGNFPCQQPTAEWQKYVMTTGADREMSCICSASSSSERLVDPNAVYTIVSAMLHSSRANSTGVSKVIWQPARTVYCTLLSAAYKFRAICIFEHRAVI
jgi:hypothetical protein